MELKNNQDLVICIENGLDTTAGEQLAEKLGVEIRKEKEENLTLCYRKEGLFLEGFGLSYQGDFTRLLPRVSNGHLAHEMLYRIAKTKEQEPMAVDATAGLGEDSFLLAACGYTLTMFEQNPVIAALLQDALERAKQHSVCGSIAERMTLIEGNSIELMPKLTLQPDLLYLDPMFPKRQKSGLIHKKLQLLQKLEQPCMEEELLFQTAWQVYPKKLVVKRPLKGSLLAGEKPNHSIQGKAIRYDCFVPTRHVGYK